MISLTALLQGGGKRKGAFAIYLEPWHADIFDFLDLRKNHGKEEARARDLFYGLWICDLFMQRVEANQQWTLFCPNEAPGLADCWGAEFEEMYHRYEAEGRGRRTVRAQDVWFAILQAQIETGTPYMLYKDACNRKSNQKNLGTIRCSNLCTEIVEFTSPGEVAVCNLACVSLPRFVVSADAGDELVGSLGAANRRFDFDGLGAAVRQMTLNLNRVIDVNVYPVKEAATSNLAHRPIGLGVQGLADVFQLLGLAYETPAAAALNRAIFEAIYFAALSQSCKLAEAEGPYASYAGSPVSAGVLQQDMWGVPDGSAHDWVGLRARIEQNGVRNSLLVAPMPTASTSQIMGNAECFDPYMSNIFSRRLLSGEFMVVNRHLMADLTALGLWGPDMKNLLLAEGGSVQRLPGFPEQLKPLYKTVWEIKQRVLVDMAADRGAWIDQSQSFNVYMANPDTAKLTALHLHGWKRGLKTGMYYLRTQPAADPIKFTVDSGAGPACGMKEGCVSCSA